MQILAKCPQCDAGLPVSAVDAPAVIACGGCGRDMPLAMSEGLRADRAVDIPARSAGARSSTPGRTSIPRWVWPSSSPARSSARCSTGSPWDLVVYGILASAALIDLAVYGRLKEVTVCYRCHSDLVIWSIDWVIRSLTDRLFDTGGPVARLEQPNLGHLEPLRSVYHGRTQPITLARGDLLHEPSSRTGT